MEGILKLAGMSGLFGPKKAKKGNFLTEYKSSQLPKLPLAG